MVRPNYTLFDLFILFDMKVGVDMKIIKIFTFPNKKRQAICVVDTDEPNVAYTVAYIMHNKDLFIEALIDSKKVEYVKEDKSE